MKPIILRRVPPALTAVCILGISLFFAACTTDAPTGESNDNNGSDVGNADTDTDPTDTDDADGDDVDPVCTPGEQRCQDNTIVEACDDDGQGFEGVDTCTDGQICEDGACVDEPDCVDGEQQCHDSTSILSCTATGNWGPPSDCPDGEACFNGTCTDGAPTGAVCDTHNDCAGGVCRCGSGESCDVDITSYCSSSCSTSSCNSGEICWASQGIDIAADDHCLAPCGSGCSLDACHPVLTETDDGYAWEDACLPDGLQQIGEECESDAECASESCYDGEFDFGFCTRQCEEGGCPDGMACVRHSSGDEYRCYDECDADSDCPGEWDVGCSGLRETPEGDTANVCASS